MKQYLTIIFLLFIIIIYSSCFEIVEEVNLNKDGSGDFCFTINISQSKMQINSMFLLDSINGKPMPSKKNLKNTIVRVKLELEKDKGISKIKISEDWENYIFSISGNFKTVADLNNAIRNINTIFNDPRGYTFEAKDNFKYKNKTFERLYSYNLIKDYNSLANKDKSILKTAKYTAVYRFETPIKSYSNTNAIKSKSSKALMLKVNIRELITNKKTIQNIIILK